MNDYIWAAVVFLLILFHHLERREWYLRMTGRSVRECEGGGKPPRRVMSAHERVLRRWRGEGR